MKNNGKKRPGVTLGTPSKTVKQKDNSAKIEKNSLVNLVTKYIQFTVLVAGFIYSTYKVYEKITSDYSSLVPYLLLSIITIIVIIGTLKLVKTLREEKNNINEDKSTFPYDELKKDDARFFLILIWGVYFSLIVFWLLRQNMICREKQTERAVIISNFSDEDDGFSSTVISELEEEKLKGIHVELSKDYIGFELGEAEKDKLLKYMGCYGQGMIVYGHINVATRSFSCKIFNHNLENRVGIIKIQEPNLLEFSTTAKALRVASFIKAALAYYGHDYERSILFIEKITHDTDPPVGNFASICNWFIAKSYFQKGELDSAQKYIDLCLLEDQYKSYYIQTKQAIKFAKSTDVNNRKMINCSWEEVTPQSTNTSCSISIVGINASIKDSSLIVAYNTSETKLYNIILCDAFNKEISTIRNVSFFPDTSFAICKIHPFSSRGLIYIYINQVDDEENSIVLKYIAP